jgi:hypothetical protein
MPQTDFFAAPKDVDQLILMIFKLDFYIVPDLTYDSPHVTCIHDFDHFEQVRNQTPLFYLVARAYMSSPLAVNRIEGSGWRAGKYCLSQREGGPSLTFYACPPSIENGCQMVGSGFISYYATYGNTISGQYEKVPRPLVSRYRMIVKAIKDQAHLVEFDCLGPIDRKYWILPEAWTTLRNGGRLGFETLEGLRNCSKSRLGRRPFGLTIREVWCLL